MNNTMLSRKIRRRRILLGVSVAIFALVLAALLTLGIMWALRARPNAVSVSSSLSPTTPATTVTTRPPLPVAFFDQTTASTNIALFDVTDNLLLYGKKADEKCYPASLTKLLTACIAIEFCPEGKTFSVGNEVYMIQKGSSIAYLKKGQILDLDMLLSALLLPSGNDAAYVLAVHIGRIIANDTAMENKAAVAVFCEQMNAAAKKIGAMNTHFVNPDGFHDPAHYTTANDMVKIAQYALAQPKIARTVALQSTSCVMLSGEKSPIWKNSNALIREDSPYFYPNATGLKTGSTDEAGYCVAASAEKDGRTVIAILFGAKTSDERWQDAKGLLDVAFK